MPDAPSMFAIDDPAVQAATTAEGGRTAVAPPGGFLPIAPNTPATGTGGYITQSGPLPATANYERERAAFLQRQEDEMFQRQLVESARVNDAGKAVAAAQSFVAMRNYSRDFESGVGRGLPPEQAAAYAFYRNPWAVRGVTGAAGALQRAGRPAVAPPPLSNTSMPITDATGNVIAQGIQTSANARQLVLTPHPVAGKLSDVAKATLKGLSEEEKTINDNLRLPGKFSSAATRAAYQTSTNRLAEIKQERAGLLAGEKTIATERKLTRELAADFLRQASGDKAKARQLARDAGYSF